MIPPQPDSSYRVTLVLPHREARLDSVLMQALRDQKDNLTLRNLSRTQFKDLFKNKKILIKGQPANPSSGVASGTTYVDILGF